MKKTLKKINEGFKEDQDFSDLPLFNQMISVEYHAYHEKKTLEF